ncbi:hypothetical protein PFISCL1PPCAC_18573, partial [Pristionchus fissidentatus]
SDHLLGAATTSCLSVPPYSLPYSPMFTPYAAAPSPLSLLGALTAPTVPLLPSITPPVQLPYPQSTLLTDQWNLGLQLYLLMQQQKLLQPLKTDEKTIKEEEEPKLSPSQTATTASPNAFSIDHLLLESKSPSAE